MADEEKKEEGSEGGDAPKPKGSLLPLLLTLINTLVILGAMGTYVYTKMLFKRPPITEKKERKKLVEKAESQKEAAEGVHGNIEIKRLTANIKPTVLKPRPGQRVGDNLRLHYASMSVVMEIIDLSKQHKFEEIRPIFMDKLLYILGKKEFQQISTVQGRFVLRNEILEMANELMKEKLITNVFFSEFVVK